MTESELRQKHPITIPDYAEIDVRPEFMGLIDEFFTAVETMDFERRQCRLYQAYESNGRLVIDYDMSPWPKPISMEIKAKIHALAQLSTTKSVGVVQ